MDEKKYTTEVEGLIKPYSPYLLSNHLDKVSHQFKHCEPKEGTYRLKGKTLTGWHLSTSTKDDVFCFDQKSRDVLQGMGDGRKYAHAKGVELTPVIFLSGYGIVKLAEFSEEMPESRLDGEDFAVTEGWKGGLALSYCGINTYVIHGCQCGHILYEFMKKHSLPTERVKHIFADTDILWNMQVNEGYKKLTHLFPNAKTMILPPTSYLTEEGTLNLEKLSPDDWITEEFDQEMVFTKVVSIKTHQQLKIQFTRTVKGDNEKKKELYTKVRAFLEENALFVPDTGLYYVFNAQSKLWEPMDIEKLTYHTLRRLDEPWAFSTTLNTIKSASSHIMYDYEDIRYRFNRPNLIPFRNGCWNILTKQFQKDLHKQDYQCSFLPFDYIENTAKKVALIAPKITSCLKDHVYKPKSSRVIFLRIDLYRVTS